MVLFQLSNKTEKVFAEIEKTAKQIRTAALHGIIWENIFEKDSVISLQGISQKQAVKSSPPGIFIVAGKSDIFPVFSINAPTYTGIRNPLLQNGNVLRRKGEAIPDSIRIKKTHDINGS